MNRKQFWKLGFILLIAGFVVQLFYDNLGVAIWVGGLCSIFYSYGLEDGYNKAKEGLPL